MLHRVDPNPPSPPIARPCEPAPRSSSPLYDTIETAAAKLDLAPEALRARCRRGATRVGNSTEAELGGGIVAFKFGRGWRVRFPAT